MKKYLLILSIVFLLSCNQDTIEDFKFEVQDEMALLGELNQLDTLQVILVEVGNLSTGSDINIIEEAEVVVLNNNDEIIDQLYYSSIHQKWRSNSKSDINSGAVYKIEAKFDNHLITSSTLVLNPIEATITNVSTEELETSIDININNIGGENSFCTIEILSREKEREATDSYTRVPVFTDNTETDNRRFNEFTPPYNRVFIPIHEESPIYTIKVTIENTYLDTQNKDYFLWVKRMDEQYYNYLYNYELQKSEYNLIDLPQLNTNIVDGIGFWGGCFKDVEQIIF
ncbi:hypothetical protein OOZ15_18700 [Galbibacter sp. EGI 63066]|uniref:hypothetical protein n=1 Tax=Galbibacter sp. EGI 63066 TaxID=2993559 RepID=UPI0022497F63|nr:hypothetical protein [Galbibacter sp. EGI 63066]MCX2681988.1 hypothetical protein [Galbibacter sp. EGI 63066]